MPEDSKKNHEKRRNDPKEQRRSRRSRQDPVQVEKKVDKLEEPKATPKATVPEQPVYESPGPEFYKNLKRETEEILKITEEESSKYKKKEIQSNWTKYELPIESYEEIEEQENLGADYEKLIQAPLSIGGHFQFKHEKSWDVNTGPSLYDKYFEIDMDNLSLALSAIPFYERNDIKDQAIFNESDMLSMNNRATRYKQKYFNDKSYSTPETEAQEKILHSLKEKLSKGEDKNENNDTILNDKDKTDDKEYKIEFTEEKPSVFETEDIRLEFNNIRKTENTPSLLKSNVNIIEENESTLNTLITVPDKIENKLIDEIDDDIMFQNIGSKEQIKETEAEIKKITRVETEKIVFKSDKIVLPQETKDIEVVVKDIQHKLENQATSIVPAKPTEAKTNPLIESPEDLEKWLDDFLDG